MSNLFPIASLSQRLKLSHFLLRQKSVKLSFKTFRFTLNISRFSSQSSTYTLGLLNVQSHSDIACRTHTRFLLRAPFAGISNITSINTCGLTESKFQTYLNVKPNLKMSQINAESLDYLRTPELDTLIKIFKDNDYEIRIAGGAVRDLLRGETPTDIDLATTATPSQMKEMFSASGTRMLDTNGESHGTITARINDKENFEITTLRIDVSTDGRHAQVAYTTDWELDANRRDLTINSMILGFDGTLYDYFGGEEDLKQHKVQFVGNPEKRIQEDYLRILRYFRFYGRVAVDAGAHLLSNIEAIEANAHGLKGISGERLWVELKKILVGNFAPSLLRRMRECKVHVYLGLPEELNVDELELVYDRTRDLNPLPITHLAALLDKEEQADKILERLKISNEELSLLRFILAERHQSDKPDLVRHYQNQLSMASQSMQPKWRARMYQLFLYWGKEDEGSQLRDWVVPVFPLNGGVVIQAGVPKGPFVAMTMDALRETWRQSRFTLGEKELKALISEKYEKVKSEPIVKRARKSSK